ncbi:hypothetical protein Vadar_033304 [Vaccinium darrowii]|uniref:Uncharacterized protein n=1 Tax=Vaccinium darrowii TaxID=229202 RepID=A0ACB7ZNH3_9ERIC|nr:hypothetical protein Vadar_033304 [Vaccinium darrowii]
MWNALAEITDSELVPEEYDAMKKNKNKSAKNIIRKEVRNFPHLPEAIVFDILVKVAARHLREDVRLVCKAWKGMISTSYFISENAIKAKPIVLMQGITSFDPQRFIVKEMVLAEQQLHYWLRDFGLGRFVRIRSSCNGLLLVNDAKRVGLLQVINLVTKCSVTLPKCPSGCPHKRCGVALGFDSRTQKYKVVHVYAESFGFEIFTLAGSDKEWKRVCGPWKDSYDRPFDIDFRWSDPILTNERFMHWYVSSDDYFISMDVSEEKFFKIWLPPGCGKAHKYGLMEFGGNLALAHNVSATQIDIWSLGDFQRQDWFKKHSILADLTKYSTSNDSSSSCTKQENGFPNLKKLVPFGSIRNGEVLVFNRNCSGTNLWSYLYETKRREMKKFKMRIKNLQRLIPHKSTLCHW